MSPSLSTSDVRYCALIDAVNFSNYLLSHAGDRTYRLHLILRKLVGKPTFLVSVPVIIAFGAKEKMRRIAATPVISARAVVKYAQSFWYWATVDKPGNSVSHNVRPASCKTDGAVTTACTRSPKPARFGNFYLREESSKQSGSNFNFQFFKHVGHAGWNLFTKTFRPASLQNGIGEVYE